MKYLKTYKIFEADGTFMYKISWEEDLPTYIKVIKGDPQNPQRLVYRKGESRDLGPQIQIPYETIDEEGGRENPDTLEFDICWVYDTNYHTLSINVGVNYGDLSACEFAIKSPGKIDVVRYTSLHSKDDPSNTIFALDDESLQSFCNYINRWDHGIHINREDLKFMDQYDNYLPT